MSESVRVFGDGTGLVGIVSPGAAPRRRAAVVLVNSGIVHRVGANRISVELARRLADDGFDTLRFDMSGLGDSADRADGLGWERSAPLEISQAVGVAADGDDERPVVLYGNCGGAAKSLWTAALDERVRGLILTNPPPHPTDSETEGAAAGAAAEAVVGELSALLDREVLTGFVYAEGDPGLAYFERRLAGPLAPYLSDGRLTVVTVSRSNHTFSPAPARRAVLDNIAGWVGGRFGERESS
jgi:pimeloyl-ACP methyl ester carboxylesterase